MDMEINEPNIWHSCCFNLDKRAVLYFSQLGISLTIVSFCIFQLTSLKSCEAQSLYSGIMMTIVGTWLPSPVLHG